MNTGFTPNWLCIHFLPTDLAWVILPLVSYKCSMYHLPIKRGFEFEVHTLRRRIQALKTSCKPYTASGMYLLQSPSTYHAHLLNVCGLGPLN